MYDGTVSDMIWEGVALDKKKRSGKDLRWSQYEMHMWQGSEKSGTELDKTRIFDRTRIRDLYYKKMLQDSVIKRC